MNGALTHAGGEKDADDTAVSDGILIEVSPGEIATAVLGRVVGILASRAGMGVDRVTEALAIAEALAAHSDVLVSDQRMRVVAEISDEGLRLVVGPLESGAAGRVLELETVPELGSVIERLADEVAVQGESGDSLAISFRNG